MLDLLAECSAGVAQLALALRELVLAEAPESEEVLYPVYAQAIVFRIPGRKHGAFCNVLAYSRHVNLMFHQGMSLSDSQRALQGNGSDGYGTSDSIHRMICGGLISAPTFVPHLSWSARLVDAVLLVGCFFEHS